MKINFEEVDCLIGGLKKVLKENRCLFRKKNRKRLKKAIRFLKSLEKSKKRKPRLLRVGGRIIKFILKLF
jgi:hypothetical protein